MMFIAELAMIVWLHCKDTYGIGVPMPVIIQSDKILDKYHYTNNGYYLGIQNAIIIPDNWRGTCEDQKRIVQLMTEHYYNWAPKKLEKRNKKDAVDSWSCLS